MGGVCVLVVVLFGSGLVGLVSFGFGFGVRWFGFGGVIYRFAFWTLAVFGWGLVILGFRVEVVGCASCCV